jgi:hypothetical protein
MVGEVQQANPQYSQIYTLGVQPGIKRDGTMFEAREYSDGVWCRFQRGTPKKMGGYNQISSTFNGIIRGMTMNAYNGVNYIFGGNSTGVDVFTTGQSLGVGSGPYPAKFNVGYAPFTPASNTTNTFAISTPSTSLVSTFTAGTKIVFTLTVNVTALTLGTRYTILSLGTTTNAQWNTIAGTSSVTYAVGNTFTSAIGTTSGLGTGTVSTQQSTNPTIYTVASSSFTTPTTTVTFTPVVPAGTVINTAYLDNTNFTANANLLWQFDFQYAPLGGILNLVAHPGQNLSNIDSGVTSQVFIGSTVPNAYNEWTFTGLADTSGTAPTYRPITVDGGVCVLHPFVFVYGSNGFIANNNVSSVYANQNLADWNGALANQVNVATGKIVKGMPVRGGTSSPSGLFWATDSLIRVSFVNNPPTYWQYDIISSQISIMSSNAVVEMDGLYFWMGVDRFYVYNGQVNVLPNDKNVNWLFDNLNYSQRQKVWATKVPRYNEIWFFYPRGGASECTDAIIYNVKDKIWYDAGQAEGAQRSSGYTTEVFPTPVWADWNLTSSYGFSTSTITTVSITASCSGTTLTTTGFPTLIIGMTILSSTGTSLGTISSGSGNSWVVTIGGTYASQTMSASISPAATTSQFYVAGDQTAKFSPGQYVTLSNLDPTATKYLISSSSYVRTYSSISLTSASCAGTALTTTGSPALLVGMNVVAADGTSLGRIVSGSVNSWVVSVGGTFASQTMSASTTPYITNTDTSLIGYTLVNTSTVFPAILTAGTVVYIISGGFPIWQHEIGLNKVSLTQEDAIYSSFTTCDISWVGGTPSEDTAVGVNRRMHLRRLEPDFVQSGNINMTIYGRKFARGPIENSGPFTFNENTEKIDLRIEHREVRLQFESNELSGNYEMGRLLITAEYGDERP